jgi:hypothetical protein
MTAQVTEAKPQFAYSRIHIPCGTAISIPIAAEKLTAADKARLAHAIHQHCEACAKAFPLTEEPSA